MSYTTSFDTANNRMNHDFGNGNSVVTDFNLATAYKLHNGEPKESFSIKSMHPDHYRNILVNIEKSLE
ncbi:MAG: hypothetical protein WCL70_08575 [Paludibacter sp.]